MNQKIFTLSIIIILCIGINIFPSFSGFYTGNACVVDLPPGMPDDTIYLSELENGMVGIYYDDAVSFRMPLTTTPVNELDPDIPAGLTIDKIEILSITNLPPGMTWEAEQTTYFPAENTDGCLSFLGTPLQAGAYLIEVNVEATILVFSQEATFFIELIIEPSTSVTEGFTMTNNTGCGEVTVSFENNIPSNGEDGFSYQWDFGNGNFSIDENPADQTYTEPGIYIVNYEAQIDTVGYILTRVQVTGVTCDDIPTAPDWSFNPDMHVEIIDPDGNIIYSSETVWNTDPPIDYFMNVPIGEGTYELKVVDEDSGINGGDDICGQVPFNKLSNGPLLAGDFTAHLDIIHPVEVIESSDTVWVFENPDAPVITDIGATSYCEDEMVVLTSSYLENNQWLLDGLPITNATDFEYEVVESGIYSVVYTDENGCTAESEGIEIDIYNLPVEPEYENVNNLLSLLGSIDYPPSITFQWYQDNEVLDGETESSYCAMEDGNYTLEVTDTETGCVNSYTQTVVFDPEAECLTSTKDLAGERNLQIYPNPVYDVLNVSFELLIIDDVEIIIYDLFGRRLYFERLNHNGSSMINQVFNLNDLTPGMYLLEIISGDQRVTQKFVKK